MEEPRRPRERELVLAPNEYAYVLDTTKGHINCYVGPNKTSLAQTDEPVVFDEATKRFRPEALKEATQLFATAPANWYLVLKNPAQGNLHPKIGQSNAMVELEVGRKTIIQGPVSFPLWPGQMARVIEGHRLSSNQFLHVRIYDADKAREAGRAALGLRSDDEAPALENGDKLLIKGTEVSFYIPPPGVEVIADENGRYIRDAVTLKRLEYCVLVGEDGSQRTIRGEAVVFPDPEQRFLVRDGHRKFQAIELSEVTGIHVKVIKPYLDEAGVERKEGEELFITGEGKLYFPREEHALIRYGVHEIHHAVAIPRGEGRYVLDRITGEVALVHGPRMFLPDPRRQVIINRILSDEECDLLYPGNSAAKLHNQGLRGDIPAFLASDGPRATSNGKNPALPVSAMVDVRAEKITLPSSLSRESWVPPRTLTLGNRFEGAIAVDVWSGYAVQIVNRQGGRRVVRGPTTELLAYDETVEPLALSRGRPKRGDDLLRTGFLKIAGNKVSDLVEVTSSDLVGCCLLLKFRVGFEGDDPARWFEVQNYVQLLCDRAGAAVKRACRQVPVRTLRLSVSDVVEDAVLGPKDATGRRPGMVFEDNAMRITDVEVLEFDIDDAVGPLLEGAQSRALQAEIALAEKERQTAAGRRIAELEQELARAKHDAKLDALALEEALLEREHRLDAERQRKVQELLELERTTELRGVELSHEIEARRIDTRLAEHDADLKKRTELQALSLREHEARVEGMVKQASAFSPHLVEALRRLGDEQLLAALSENFSELAAVEGKGLLETARKFLDFAPASVMPMMRSTNGESHEA